MTEINSLLNEYKVLTELVEDAAVEGGRTQAIQNANQRISNITRQLWNLGISPAQIQRLASA
jgi:hypothetical protein